jgi:hypothetical protein
MAKNPMRKRPVQMLVLRPIPSDIPARPQRILSEFLLAEPRQRIVAFSSVDCLDGNQHAHLRRDLNHPSVSRQARSRIVQSGGAVAFHSIRILLPPEDAKSITHSSSSARDGAEDRARFCARSRNQVQLMPSHYAPVTSRPRLFTPEPQRLADITPCHTHSVALILDL